MRSLRKKRKVEKQEDEEAQAFADAEARKLPPKFVGDPVVMAELRNNLKLFEDERFDFIRLSYPEGWEVETKAFGEENTAKFIPSDPDKCPTDTCGGIRLKKGNARLELLSGHAIGSTGYGCTQETNAFTLLENNWARLNELVYDNFAVEELTFDGEVGKSYDFWYTSEYSQEVGAPRAKRVGDGNWMNPDFIEGPDNYVFDFCYFAQPLVPSTSAFTEDQLNDESYEAGVLIDYPVLFFDGEVDYDLLTEADVIVETIEYPTDTN